MRLGLLKENLGMAPVNPGAPLGGELDRDDADKVRVALEYLRKSRNLIELVQNSDLREECSTLSNIERTLAMKLRSSVQESFDHGLPETPRQVAGGESPLEQALDIVEKAGFAGAKNLVAKNFKQIHGERAVQLGIGKAKRVWDQIRGKVKHHPQFQELDQAMDSLGQ